MRNNFASRQLRNMAAASLTALIFGGNALAGTGQQLTQDAPPIVVCGSTLFSALTTATTNLGRVEHHDRHRRPERGQRRRPRRDRRAAKQRRHHDRQPFPTGWAI